MSMRSEGIKGELLAKVSFVAEIDELLGRGKGNVRRCFNRSAHTHGDKSPSLSFNPRNGAWKCHTCGEKGDIFTLHMRVNGTKFPETFKYYLEKYGLWSKLTDFDAQRFSTTKRKRFRTMANPTERAVLVESLTLWTHGSKRDDRLGFMETRYGLTHDTLRRWRIAYSRRDNRVWIPIWAGASTVKGRAKTDTRLPAIVNIRKHDCFRRWAKWYNEDSKEWITRGRPRSITLEAIADQNTGAWVAKYKEAIGKVISVRGHGAPYVYPTEILMENSSMYLVGGELKALLMIQLGRNAITFTCGEGGYSTEWLPYFTGKHIRVLFDADPAADLVDFKNLNEHEQLFCDMIGRAEVGLSNAERATCNMAQVLADHGAYVEAGIWPEEVKSKLPPKGDVTDLLRMAGWNPAALDFLEWYPVERNEDPELEERVQLVPVKEGEELPKFELVDKKKFGSLVDPLELNQFIRVRGIIAGRGEAPYVVPSAVTVRCPSGEKNVMPRCMKCPLPKCGFRVTARYHISAQIEFVGMSQEKVERQVLKELGVPTKCRDFIVDFTPATAEVVMLTPTVDMTNDDDGVSGIGDVSYEYAHRQAYLVGECRIAIKENVGYEVAGKVMSDPRKGVFTLAGYDWRKIDNDILSFNPTEEQTRELEEVIYTGDGNPVLMRDRLLADIRDNIVQQIYGQDSMIEAIFLSYFLPFVFTVGGHVQERVCPSVMILGDTNVGKSTATTKILQHFGAGRPYSANADPTFAGLVGGNLQTSSRMAFVWGVLPTAHRALVMLDEYNKLSLETIGKLTNVLSSGVAERTTVSGPRRTQSWVRILALCNPRGDRALTHYGDPLQAALNVAGTVQDLGRFEYVYIQYQLRRAVLSRLMRKAADTHGRTEHRYRRDIARYHLQWAWNLTHEKIIFEDARDVFKRSMDLADRFGGHTVFLPAQARFKLARIAAAFATMLFSHDKNLNLVVKPEHVSIAVKFFEQLYSPYIDGEKYVDGSAVVPDELVKVLDRVPRPRRLRMFVTTQKWSYDDIEDSVGPLVTKDFLDVVQFDLGYVSRRAKFFYPRGDDFQEIMEAYILERERLDLIEKGA